MILAIVVSLLFIGLSVLFIKMMFDFNSTNTSQEILNIQPEIPQRSLNTDNAYVTLCTKDNYVPGTIMLARSLAETKTKYPLIVMSCNLSEESRLALKRSGVHFFELQNIKEDLNVKGWLGETYNKLFAWTIPNFKKLVFLDSDMIITENIDELFHYDEFSVCSGSLPGKKYTYNTGLFVLKPDKKTFNHMMKFMKTLRPDKLFGDQEFLIKYFPNAYELSDIYNRRTWELKNSKPKVFHYNGPIKPWNMNRGLLSRFYISEKHYKVWCKKYDKYTSLKK